MKAACVGGMVPAELTATSYSPPTPSLTSLTLLPLSPHTRGPQGVSVELEEKKIILGETIRQLVFETPLRQVSTLPGTEV